MKNFQIDLHGPDREQQFLQQVSRSFALTIPQLPSGLRERVANAYLLCRITDTIEDEVNLRLEEKKRLFQEFMTVIDGDRTAEDFIGDLAPRLNGSTLPAERDLVLETGAVVRHYRRFSPQQRAIIRRCLSIMSDGMLHFQQIKLLTGLPDLGHLEAYCYAVAGVVGEMLTDLFCDHSRETAVHRGFLFQRAASFGQGLQMTNILKDMWEDRECGVCWLPQDVFRRSGCDLRRIDKNAYTPQFGRGLVELIAIAHGHLVQAMAYALRIPPSESGMRKFCLWAIGMAVATLQNIYRLPQYVSGAEVKINRRKLKTIILASNVAVGHDGLLRMLFRAAARGLPLAPAAKVRTAIPAMRVPTA